MPGSDAQAHRDGDRLIVFQLQWRHGRAPDQAVPAGHAHGCCHRVSELTKTVYITPDRAGTDPQALREFST